MDCATAGRRTQPYRVRHGRAHIFGGDHDALFAEHLAQVRRDILPSMRRVLAFVAGFMLAGCSATGGNLISVDGSADVSGGATDAHADRSMADESE
jgi:hypothetical protein